tara:strand:+ start:191 stop:709 length:519 start_codon:yes stop_codon:yes gene_type:complete
MKLTKSKLKQLIKEEIETLQFEGFFGDQFGKLKRKAQRAVGVDPWASDRGGSDDEGEEDAGDDEWSSSPGGGLQVDTVTATNYGRIMQHSDNAYALELEGAIGRPRFNALTQATSATIDNTRGHWVHGAPDQATAKLLAQDIRSAFEDMPEHLGGAEGYDKFSNAVSDIYIK